MTSEGKTLLPHYLGMYRLTVNNAETYWLVMRNILSSSVKVHRKFDLKGSTVDRAASHKEKVKSFTNKSAVFYIRCLTLCVKGLVSAPDPHTKEGLVTCIISWLC